MFGDFKVRDTDVQSLIHFKKFKDIKDIFDRNKLREMDKRMQNTKYNT